MNKDINLAGKVKKVRLPKERLNLIRRVAVFTAILTTILAILTFFISIQFSLSSAKAEEDKVGAQLTSFQKKIAQERLLKDRLKQLRKVEIERNSDLGKLDAIMSKAPGDVDITALSLDQTGINVVFDSPSLTSLNTLIDSVSKLKDSKTFKSLEISELKYKPNVGYELTIGAN